MNMVSTRGVKLKFFESERVLCYEPDPTKAKVLYDSKVLDILVKKDIRGKKYVEYMIHFQGWNSSWDRSVSEEYVLKDTPENRQLQRDLAEKSQLHIGAYLYRKERKKHSRSSCKVNDRAAQSSEDGSCGSPTLMEEEETNAPSSSTDEESSAEEDIIPIELNQTLKEYLEHDYYFIKTKHKLHKLPCDIPVVHVLEEYWRWYVKKLLSGVSEKPSSRSRQSQSGNAKLKTEDIQRRLTLCKEVLDGIRVYFDFTLNDLLLYNPEKGQVITIPTKSPQPSSGKLESPTLKMEVEDQEYAHLPVVDDDDSFQSDIDSASPSRGTRRRTLRSNKSCDSNSNGIASLDSSNKLKNNSVFENNCVDINGVGVKIPIWKAVPEVAYTQTPLPPCLVYGPTHLLRLFVKLPELLAATTITDDKMKIIVDRCEHILGYLSEHSEWFQESNYIDVKVT